MIFTNSIAKYNKNNNESNPKHHLEIIEDYFLYF